MTSDTFRDRLMRGDMLAGTFQKTPSYILVEVLATAGVDFVCLDAEHAPFDKSEIDACIAVGRGVGVPVFVRTPSSAPEHILSALDAGAAGVVVPHVDTPEIARKVAASARFGRGGRGYAGSTRFAGYATRPMSEVLPQTRETIVLAQIEDPAAVDCAAEIAAVDGIDGLFVGPADLSVAYGKTDQSSGELADALRSVGVAAKAAGKAYVTWVGTAAQAAAWRDYGFTMFFVASEHAWMRQGALATMQEIHDLA